MDSHRSHRNASIDTFYHEELTASQSTAPDILEKPPTVTGSQATSSPIASSSEVTVESISSRENRSHSRRRNLSPGCEEQDIDVQDIEIVADVAETDLSQKKRKRMPSQPGSMGPPMQQDRLPSIHMMTSGMPNENQSPMRSTQNGDALHDSGSWFLDSHSKHNSVASTNGTSLHIQTILNDSPTSTAHYGNRLPLGMAQTPVLPHLSQSSDPPRPSFDSSILDSRRGSVDSRMNFGMGGLHLTSPTSPYESHNASQASLASSLQQQRGIPVRSPTRPRNSRGQPLARVAPAIAPNLRSVSGMPDPTAPKPTPGFAWAFPDAGDPRRMSSSSGESTDAPSLPSRKNSMAASFNSSIYTNDSAMPMGQKRFEDVDPALTHHHSMQHRAVTSLQNGDNGIGSGAGSYSRTPELRIQHKHAERRRRGEMKTLFEQLNTILPNSSGSKASKFDVLTKATEFVKEVKTHNHGAEQAVRAARAEREHAEKAQTENNQLRDELTTLYAHLRRMDPHGELPAFGEATSRLAYHYNQPQPQPQPQPYSSNSFSNSLPPLRSTPSATQGQWGPPAAPMQGLEFPRR